MSNEKMKGYLDGRSGEGATNLHTIGDDGGGDHLVVGNLLHDLVVGGLIEDASIGELVSDLDNNVIRMISYDNVLPFPWTTSS